MQPKPSLESVDPKDRDKALFHLAQVTVAGRIGSALSSEAMRELIEFEKKDGHVALGFPRWVDFLEESEYSPMTKHQYYDRKELFQKENAEVWDRLTDLGVPINLRKRLPAGAFEISDDAIVITAEDGTKQSMPLAEANRTQIIETVKILHESLLEKTKKLEKGKEDFRKERERRLKAEENEGNGTARTVPALEKAHTVATGGLAALATELEQASDRDCQAYADGQISLLVSQINRINLILNGKIGIDSIADLAGTDDEAERLAGLLDD